MFRREASYFKCRKLDRCVNRIEDEGMPFWWLRTQRKFLPLFLASVCQISVFAAGGTGGALDTSFDPGVGPDTNILSASLQTDGKIIIAGEFTSVGTNSRNHIARLNADGSLDQTFDP